MGGSVRNITIGDSANVTARSNTDAGIGSFYGNTGNITIGNNAQVTASAPYYPGINSSASGTVTQNVTNLDTGLATLTEPGTDSTPTNTTTTTTTEIVEIPTTTTVTETVTETVEVPTTFLNNVVVHFGDKAGQVLGVIVGDMHTKSLRANVPSEADKERLTNLQNDADKYKAFQALLEKVQTMTLDDINFRTREDANIAIRVVDSAPEYATDQATNIAAYLQRLDFTLENVIKAQENTQAAESTIRDADMAREMTNYARANILSQSAQSMLAHINQNSGNVINLLK